MPNAPSGLTGGRTKACDACRGLKLRCDAHQFDYESCSRCSRLGRHCVISHNPRRRNRQTKAELEDELNKLRTQVGGTSSVDDVTGQIALALAPPRPTSLPTSISGSQQNLQFSWSDISYSQGFANGVTVPSTDLNSITTNDSPSIPSRGSLPSTDWTSPKENSIHHSPPNGETTNGVHRHPMIVGANATPKSIGGLSLSSSKIQDCFTQFFTHYAIIVPTVFDDDQDPEEVFRTSSFLFWTIVHVGARRSKDPTIVESLARPLAELAQKVLFNPDYAMPSIKAAIALCTWPAPIHSTYQDPCHAISGAALQLAIQKGLPFASRKQDFARMPVEQAEKDRLYNSRLWMYGQMVFQSNSLMDGLPCAPTMEIAQTRQEQMLFNGLPSLVFFRYQLHQIQVESSNLILRTVDLTTNTDSSMLRSLIEHFDATTRRIVPPDNELVTQLLLIGTRIITLSYYFFTSPDTHRDAGMIQLYGFACDLITLAAQLDKEHDFAAYCTHWQSRATFFAAFIILRIHRSHLQTIVDTQRGEEMFFEAIRISKKRSILNNDLDARNSTILTQLWSSAKLFKYKDGTVDGLRLLLRGRLHMSLVFECLWWWRSEFGGTSNPYVQSENSKDNIASANDNGMMSDVPIMDQGFSNAFIEPEQIPEWLMDCSGMPNWQWDPNFSWNPVQYTQNVF